MCHGPDLQGPGGVSAVDWGAGVLAHVPAWYTPYILSSLGRNELVRWAEKPPISRCIKRDRSFHVIFFASCFSCTLALLPLPLWWWIPLCVLALLFTLYLAHRAYRRLDRCYVLTNLRFMMFRPSSLLSDTVVLFQSFDVEELAVGGIVRCEHYSRQRFRTLQELRDREVERETALRREGHVLRLGDDDDVSEEKEITRRGGCVYFFAQDNWRAVFHIANVRDLAECLRSTVALRLCFSPAISRRIIQEKEEAFQRHGLQHGRPNQQQQQEQHIQEREHGEGFRDQDPLDVLREQEWLLQGLSLRPKKGDDHPAWRHWSWRDSGSHKELAHAPPEGFPAAAVEQGGGGAGEPGKDRHPSQEESRRSVRRRAAEEEVVEEVEEKEGEEGEEEEDDTLAFVLERVRDLRLKLFGPALTGSATLMDHDAMLRKEEESLLLRFRISKLFSVLRFLAAVVLSVLLYWLQCTSTEHVMPSLALALFWGLAFDQLHKIGRESQHALSIGKIWYLTLPQPSSDDEEDSDWDQPQEGHEAWGWHR